MAVVDVKMVFLLVLATYVEGGAYYLHPSEWLGLAWCNHHPLIL